MIVSNRIYFIRSALFKEMKTHKYSIGLTKYSKNRTFLKIMTIHDVSEPGSTLVF